MTIEYDLHSHSTASDGTLAPAELVQRAHAAGVQVLALTDHDTTDGIAGARTKAEELGLQLIPGVEVSVNWHSQTVHVLGLNIDPHCRVLQPGLQRLQAARDWRAEEIGRRLHKAGIAGAFEGASALARGRIVSRTHFARFLVEQGHARNVRKVFQHYLVHGKPGHVAGEWASLEEALDWITQAGGMAVIAHPARYRMTARKLSRLIGEFRELGGIGLEVVSGSHTRENINTMGALARTEGLLASRGSDYHGPENPWVQLGSMAELPAGCSPVWESDAWPVH
ncbi:MAG: PHP domain-containing protein [Gammaproteobacteria bacterium]|nr:MAG: PHP domain-containing protein [Gammaproteobacteria bacterium]